MGPFRSIEDRHGVNEPGYEPPVEPTYEIAPITDSRTLSLLEAFVVLTFPALGVGLSVWRFGRGDVGPGIADLMLSLIGWVIAATLFAAGIIRF
jgi:hypothetical protein